MDGGVVTMEFEGSGRKRESTIEVGVNVEL